MATNVMAFSPTLAPLALALLFTTLQTPQGAAASAAGDYVPVWHVEHRSLPLQAAAAAYRPFQLCLPCLCSLAADPSSHVASSCCYAIGCNLPDKPFGVCSFLPKTCDCTNCTQP